MLAILQEYAKIFPFYASLPKSKISDEKKKEATTFQAK